MKPILAPLMSPALLRKGVIPAALMAAITGPAALNTLAHWEGDIHKVYADHLAGGLPTFCAGRTDWTAKVGVTLTGDFCREVNKATLLEYGYAEAQFDGDRDASAGVFIEWRF